MAQQIPPDPLDAFIGQLSRMAALFRASQSESCCPMRLMQQVAWQLGDDAFFHRVDVMRRYRWNIPRLKVKPDALSRHLRELVRMAIKASGEGGAVVCDLFYDQDGLRFSIADSSGVSRAAEQWPQMNDRYSALADIAQAVREMQAELVTGIYPGAGVVVELVFPLTACERADTGKGQLQAANDRLDIAIDGPINTTR